MTTATTFTDLEQTVLTALVSKLNGERDYSNVSISDLSKASGVATKILRGVLTSLAKKGAICVDTTANWSESIVYLQESHFYLHPVWGANQ